MSFTHIVLVGLPGAGKTTAGRLLARRLDVPFYDVDALIEERSGRTVSQVFAQDGEARFRSMERETVAALLAEARPSVVAPGGGWAAAGDNLDAATTAALTIYLVVDPRVAAERLAGAADRPLLAGDPAKKIIELFALRCGAYERCRARVDSGNQPIDGVVDELVKLARTEAGW